MDTEALFRSEAWLNWLFQFVNPDRQQRFLEKIEQRTRKLTVILENIYQPHNASAVLRSCECFGIQDVHVIENRFRFKSIQDVSLGSAQWLTVHRYKDGLHECVQKLKNEGYTIYATTPHTDDVDLETVKISPDRPIALMMGTEKEGLSEEALSLADAYLKIPMYGFTESLNISVSAAIAIHYLNNRLRKQNHWQLSPVEKREILIQWAASNVRNLPEIRRQFTQNLQQPLEP